MSRVVLSFLRAEELMQFVITVDVKEFDIIADNLLFIELTETELELAQNGYHARVLSASIDAVQQAYN